MTCGGSEIGANLEAGAFSESTAVVVTAPRRPQWRVPFARAPFLLMLAALASFGCSADQITYEIGQWAAESETRVDRTRFEYVMRPMCENLGTAETAGAAAVVGSVSPHTEILEDQVRCPALPPLARAPAVDTIRLRHDRSEPFDPEAIQWLALVWGPETLVEERRIDAARFEYVYEAELMNAFAEEQDVVATLSTPAPELVITDPRVEGTALAALVRARAADRFAFQLDRTQPYDPDALVWQLELGSAIPVDTTPPLLGLSAPARVQAGQPFRASADAQDASGVASVEWLVDGLAVETDESPPFLLDYGAPDAPGAVLALLARATDTEGNEAEATAEVMVVAEADAEPPVVTRLVLPASAAPGSVFVARAEASDDRGVTELRFSLGGAPPLVDPSPPFAVTLQVPADATVGSRLDVVVEAADAAGNAGGAAGEVEVVAVADTQPPTGVGLTAPGELPLGARAVLVATAVDDVGVASVHFFANGEPVGTDATPPYAVSVALPPDIAVGALVQFTATASDFAGNTSDAQPAVTSIVASGAGLLLGEVYDDATGRPLEGARVRLLEAAGALLSPAQEQLTDAAGRYRFALDQGAALVAVGHPDYTDAWRRAEVPPDGVGVPFDARLTPRAAGASILRGAGGNLLAPQGAARLDVPIASLVTDADVTLTRLGAQGLPAPLPPGWTPLAAFEVDAGGVGFSAPVALALLDPALAAVPVAAQFDAATAEWRRAEVDASAVIALDAPGSVALLRPDALPQAPATPPVGEPLAGVAAVPLPAGAFAELLPRPEVIFLAPDARADVAAHLRSSAPVPSGTPIEVVFTEQVERIDGARLALPDMAQDLFLYAEADGPTARFPATPGAVFDPALVREGLVRLDARERAAEPLIVGTAGGEVEAGNVSASFPAGALVSDTPIGLEPIAPATSGLEDGSFELLAGLLLDLGGERLATSAVLQFALPEAPQAGDRLLLLHEEPVQGRTELVLAGVGEADGARVSAGAGGLGLPLRGVVAEGRYWLVRLVEPAGFVTGAIGGGTAQLDALVRADTLPFVGRSDASDPRYVVAAALGDAAVSGSDLATGDAATGTASLGAPDALESLDLALSPRDFSVVEVSPPDGTDDASVALPLVIRLSEALDAVAFSATSVRLDAPGGGVASDVSLAADRRGIVVRPQAPLEGATAHVLRIEPGLADVLGRVLTGNRGDGAFESAFTTVDTAPPPRPAAGQVGLSIPSDGISLVRGSVGTAPPGSLVVVSNVTRAVASSVLAGDDGSFLVAIGAEPDDEVRVAIIGPSGEALELDPIPFSDADGRFVLGARGGLADTPGGVRASLLPGALLRTATVRLVDEAALPAPLPAGLEALGGFSLALEPGLFNDAQEVAVSEDSGRFPESAGFETPLRVETTFVSADTVSVASRFGFLLTSRNGTGDTRALAAEATGRDAPCGETQELADDAAAPRLRLRAPSCLGPQEAFQLLAEAVQPRFDVSVPLPAGTAPASDFLVLRHEPASGHWVVEDVAAAADGLVETRSATPFGVRGSGRYAVVRSAQPLAFVEGRNAGESARVESDALPGIAALADANGAFLLPVLAGSAAELRRIEPASGDVLATLALAPLAAGDTDRVGRFGAPGSALSVAAELPPDAELVGRSPLPLAFSEPVELSSVTPASFIVTDSRGRAIAGVRIASGDGTRVRFFPLRPWRFGEAYAYRVTPGVAASSGATLDQEETGAFSGFRPRVVARLAGEDVKDAAAEDVRVHFLDEGVLRSADLTDPASPEEGPGTSVSPPPNALAFEPSGGDLLVAVGKTADPGEIQRFVLAEPLAPASDGTRPLTTPAGAPAAAGAAAAAGEPASLAVEALAAFSSTRGIGLQRVALAEIGSAPASPPPQHPAAGGASFTDVAAADARIAAVGPDGLTILADDTLAVLGTADVEGTAQDVALAPVAGRLLALVAAGLVGGLQVYAVDADGVPTRVARVPTGCATARVAVDAPLARAWVACSGARLGVVDLAFVDGLEPIDEDGDGDDDRLAGLLELPGPLAELDLDEPRALGLVSARSDGLVVLQLGPAEAVIEDVLRDVLPGDQDDELPIRASGRAFFGDQAVLVDVEARIPPGHPGLRAVLSGDAPLEFEGGGLERPLVAGAQRLRVLPTQDDGATPTSFDLRILDADESLASFAGRLLPVPLDALAAVDGDDVAPVGATPAPLVISGVDGSGVLYHLTPLASFETADPAVGQVGPDGVFVPASGGETDVVFEVGGRRQSLLATATLPPGIAFIELVPDALEMRTGEQVALAAEGELTDGELRALVPSDGLAFASSDLSVANVDTSGAVLAVGPGEAVITATAPSGTEGFAEVLVSSFVPPDLSGIEFDVETTQVFTEDAVVGAGVTLLGSGSLDRIDAEFRLEGFGTDAVQTVASLADATATVLFEDLDTPAVGTLSVRVVDPDDGEVFTDSVAVEVLHRNRDAEPNDSIAEALRLDPFAAAQGSVGDGDPGDVYRVVPALPGTLLVALVGGGTQLELLDAAGVQLASGPGDGDPLEVEVPGDGAPVFVRVTGPAEATAYAVETRFTGATPVIDSISPPSGAPGEVVAIRGSGFAPMAADNTVFFGGLRTDVVSVAAGELQVVVPAFATDGDVIVWVGSAESNAVPFTTGAPHWFSLAFDTDVEDADQVLDEEGQTVVRDRIEVSFQPSVLRARVEEIAAAQGAEIVGLWPPRNAYELRFPGNDVPALEAKLPVLNALPEVRYSRLLVSRTLTAFAVAGRDDFPGRQVPATTSTQTDARMSGAYAQVRAFEAWQWLADSGFFNKQSDFGTVRVGVIDMGLVFTDQSAPQIASNQMLHNFDLKPPPPNKVAIDDHGTLASGVIGARNVKDAKRRNTGILGGAVPADSPFPHFYRIDLYDAGVKNKDGESVIQDREQELAIEACPGAPAEADGSVPPCANVKPMDVVNMSYGTYLKPGSGDIQFYRDLMKSRPNTLFVTSAGNKHRDARKHVPSRMTLDDEVGDRVISTAAVSTGWRRISKNRRADVRASFSNYGRGVDIAAPGEHVLSVSVFPEKPSSCRPGVLPSTSSFDFFCGTSAAAPLVTGTAALMKAISPSLTPAELKKMLIESATPLRRAKGAKTWGVWSKPRRLDVLRAVQMAMRHRAGPVGLGGASAPKDYLPGKRRDLWAVDRQAGRIGHATLSGTFELSLNAQEIDLDPPASLSASGCQDPFAVTPTATGEKLYIACRDSNQVLVWHANSNKPTDFTDSPNVESRIALQLGGTAFQLPLFPSIQMALSLEGQILAVPLRGRRVGFIDTRKDELVEVRKFKSTVNVGDVRAIAFGSNDRLYAVTAESSPQQISRGQLVRQKRSANSLQWKINTSAGLDIENLFSSGASAVRDGPQGLTILPKLGSDQIYVTYGGPRTETAATVHKQVDLELLNPPGSSTGKIRSNVAGRQAEIFRAGEFVGSTAGAFTVFLSTLETGTSLPMGLAIDPTSNRAYIGFRGTGNVGVLRPQTTGSTTSFQRIASATSILGEFQESRLEQVPQLEVQLLANGTFSAQLIAPIAARAFRLYFQDDFPISFGMDQAGGLLASHLTGADPRLRIWSTRGLRTGDDFIASTAALEAADTTIEEALDTEFQLAPPLQADFDIGVQAAPSLAFANVLSVAAPGPGAITRGVVAVHPVIRDSNIDKIRCEVRKVSNGALVRSDAGTTVASADAAAGLPSRTGSANLGTPIPVCRFPRLNRGSYVMRLIATTQFGDTIVADSPFKHEAW